ncbi:MAG: copper resistance D family protein [Cycloclasticus sp.]
MDFFSLFSILSKLTLYIGALFASGTVIYLMLFDTIKARSSYNGRQMTGLFSIIGLVSALTSYALAGARLTGELSDAFDPDMLSILWQTPVGTALLFRVLGFSLIIIGLFSGKMSKSLTAIGCLVVLGSFVTIGHVADISNFVFQILLLIHLIGIAIWVGVLFPLYRLSSDPAQITTTEEIAHRFGRLAMIFVPVLLIAGGWMAYQLVNSFTNLFTTGYGQTLLIKVVITTGLLTLAAANKLRFVPALRVGDSAALKHLKYSVLAEIMLVIFILSTTAVLTSVLTLPEAHS